MASTKARVLALVLSQLSWSLAQSEVPDDLNYARVSLFKRHRANHSEILEETISGVYALYGPVRSVGGVLLVSSPIDACETIELPDRGHDNRPFILLARLDTNSRCSAVEQGINAARAGAVGILNMAPQRTSYIYLLERTQQDEGNPVADIAQVAISGSSGYNFLSEIIGHHGKGELYVTIGGGAQPQEQSQVLDLVVAIACMVIAVLVLLYAYRVGRNLCINQESIYVQDDGIPTAEQLRDKKMKMAKLLKSHINIVSYKPPEGLDEPDCCAVCIDTLEAGDEIRELQCKHCFHVDCIDPWLLNKQTCPLCKDDVLARIEADLGDIQLSECDSGSTVSDMARPTGDAVHQLVTRAVVPGRGHILSMNPSHSYEGDPTGMYLPRSNNHGSSSSGTENSSMDDIVEMIQLGRPHVVQRGALSDMGHMSDTGSGVNMALRPMTDPGPSLCSWQSVDESTHSTIV